MTGAALFVAGGEVVVVDFYAEDDDRADEGDDVGDPECPHVGKEAQNDKEGRTEAHHNECGHCDAVGIACAYGGVCLGDIAQYHADCCSV